MHPDVDVRDARMNETVIQFSRTASLVGILGAPAPFAGGERLPAVVMLNAGIIHRVGPNRLYVKIARELAAAGFRTFRFDFSGVGDSEARSDGVPFESRSVEETQAAMDYLATARVLRCFVLLGLCSGANIAFRTARRDSRVAGIIGINGTYLNDGDYRRMHQRLEDGVRLRYCRGRLLDGRTWWRLITGRSDIRSLARVAGRIMTRFWNRSAGTRCPARTAEEWRELVSRGVDSLVVYSEGSSALDALPPSIRTGLRGKGTASVISQVIRHTDHVFTPLWSQRVLIDAIRMWMLGEQRAWRARDPRRKCPELV